ncbi:MAG: nitrilase-related carbon-nitrogen hydrolase, partial [Candidatus Latescibacterota bacterium]
MTAVADLPVIALAQMEVRPGRPDLNVEQMEALITEARAVGAEVVAFPEMCVPGYILGDL